MTIQQMLAAGGGKKLITFSRLTTAASPPAGFTNVPSNGSAQTGAFNVPAGYTSVILFVGWGANHMYVELTAAQFAASTINNQLTNGSGGSFFANIQKNGVNYLTTTQSGGNFNNSGFTVDTAKLFPGTNAVDAWAVWEFYG